MGKCTDLLGFSFGFCLNLVPFSFSVSVSWSLCINERVRMGFLLFTAVSFANVFSFLFLHFLTANYQKTVHKAWQEGEKVY